MLFVIYDLTSSVTPARAVAELEGLRFKRVEHRLKRYSRAGHIAEAVHNGPLRVMHMRPSVHLDAAVLIDKRYMTQADFPWTSHMDTESLVLQHTTFVTHRVSVVCESGVHGEDTSSVRLEWDFASGKAGQGDDSERVDWVLERLGCATDVPASLQLKRLLRLHKAGSQIQGNGEGTSPGVRSEDASGTGGSEAGGQEAGCDEDDQSSEGRDP